MNRFQKYLAQEFAEDYEEGRLSRREALKLIASVTGSAMLANSILAACTPPAPAAETVTASGVPAAATPASEFTDAASEGDAASPYGTVMPDDPAVRASMVEFPGTDALIKGYFALPAAEGSPPAVFVCHENRGLNAHIEDVTRRLAKAGYAALAVDLLSRQGGTAAVGASNVPGALGGTAPDQFVDDFLSGWRFLQEQSHGNMDRVGMVGFCFGGGVTWLVATRMPELKAAVPFYGPHPPPADIANINAAVLAIYAEGDQRINQGIPAIEQAMTEQGKIYEKIVYPGTDHAFHNDTGSRYAPEAARDAWERTLAWFLTYL